MRNTFFVRLSEQLGDQFRQGLRVWHARRTAAVLQELSDDLLSDIGITRGEIPSIALRVTALPADGQRERDGASAARPTQTAHGLMDVSADRFGNKVPSMAVDPVGTN